MPDEECFAEQVDGSWTYCGCPECDQREWEDLEDAWQRTRQES